MIILAIYKALLIYLIALNAITEELHGILFFKFLSHYYYKHCIKHNTAVKYLSGLGLDMN